MAVWSGTTTEFGRWTSPTGVWSSPFAGMEIAYDSRGNDLFGGVRFDGVNVPGDGTVTSATLTITNSYSTGVPFVSLFALDDAPALATGQQGTTRTSPEVQATATSSSVLTVTGLGPQVQQVIDRAGWSSGNAMAFFFRADTAAGDMATRQGANFSLEIEWDPPYDAGADQTVDAFGTVTLTGTPSGASWTQVSGESVTLQGSGATRTFTAPGKMTQHALVFSYGGDETTVTVRAAKHAIVGSGGVLHPTNLEVL